MNSTLSKIEKTLNAIKFSELTPEQKDRYTEMVQKQLKCFPDYFNYVINFSMQSTIAKVRYEGQEYRDYMQDLDIRRRSKHILVTDAVNVLNRISEAFGVGQIFPTERVLDGNNREDREVAVNLVYNFCTQVYLDEIERSKYNIENKDMHHELHRMSERGGTFHSERVYNGDDFER